MKYKVEHLLDNTYKVLEKSYVGANYTSKFPPRTMAEIASEETWNTVFQGSISDCEAWIRLNEQGYM